MKNNLLIVSVVFLALLLLLMNPFGWWMPNMLSYMIVAALAVVAAVYAGLVKGEKARDEREVEIRAHAARAGYLAGIFALTLAIAATVLSGKHVDVWISTTLAVMIIVRMFVRSKVE